MDEAFEALRKLKTLDSTVTRMGSISALLEWDQETFMPPAAAEERAAQIALMAGLHHDKCVDTQWEESFSLLELEKSSAFSDTDAAFLREARKRWDKKLKVPKRLVEETAQARSLAQSAWISARKADDFASFAPHLRKVIELQREYAQIIDPEKDPYDVLLDEYEPGAAGDEIAEVFDGLSVGLKTLMDKIAGGSAPDVSFLRKSYDEAKQDEFGRKVQAWMGYDTSRGRLDLSVHPFTTNLGPDDVRVTTRYYEKLVSSGLFSNIHEAGHGLYEQGFGEAVRGSLLADGASLGIHESQSRFWENTIGRSLAFWKHWYPTFSSLFNEPLKSIDLEDFYRGVNTVEPSLIRVEADEVTYSFHIIIRFRLERRLISGDLTVEELPGAWNTAYKELLGIDVPSDSDGCMQDIHWAAGLFGYFPTYALGNLYAAGFVQSIEKQLGPLSTLMSDEGALRILGWLRENIHVHGRVYSPGELCRRITGADLNPSHFLEYLESKYSQVYRF